MKTLLKILFRRPRPVRAVDDVERARRLIAAIDAGGLPLDPEIVRRVAESFGLEVSRNARMADTIARIRAALDRCER